MKKIFLSLGIGLLLSSCGSSKIFTTTTSGENLIMLSKVTENNDSFSPVSDGADSPMFYIFSDGNSYSNLYKKDNPLSSAVTQITDGKNYISFPTYCAAINKVAFRARLEGSNQSDIYMMNATQGKALTQVTSTPNDTEDSPSFSKDGNFLAYERYPVSGGESQIWIKNLQTGENSMLGKGRYPAFSPDGKQIAYSKPTGDGIHATIWIMDVTGDNQTQLTDNTLRSAQRPKFSPDGNYIVFDATNDKGNMDIYTIEKDGKNLTRLTINESTDAQPFWSEDGYIYFASDRGDKKANLNIWRFKTY